MFHIMTRLGAPEPYPIDGNWNRLDDADHHFNKLGSDRCLSSMALFCETVMKRKKVAECERHGVNARCLGPSTSFAVGNQGGK